MAGVQSILMTAAVLAVGAYFGSSEAVKNVGKLATEQIKAREDEEIYASAEGISSRDPNVGCSVKPPQMISTSLLPAEGELTDADFVGITPDKLKEINFLSTGWQLGRDTQANTMRNASYDLRSEPLNPKILNMENNSFSNSTISNHVKRSFEPEAVGSA